MCYPRRFRREHGDELVDTLLEMAEPGQTRPTMRETWHLVVDGMKMRLRLPADRPLARLTAILIALIAAAAGGAAAAWATMEVATPLPNNATVAALTRQVAPGGHDFALFRSSMAWWVLEPARRTLGTVDVPVWEPLQSRASLAAEGWHVGAIDAGTDFDADRNGVHMWVSGIRRPEGVTVQVGLMTDTPPRAPAVIAGVLLGPFLGWLLTAAAAYRMRRLPIVRRRAATTLCGLGIAALALPASAVSLSLARILHLPDSIEGTLHEAVSDRGYEFLAISNIRLQLAVVGPVLIAAAWAMTLNRGSVVEAEQNDMPAAG